MLAPNPYSLRPQPRDVRLALAQRFRRVRKTARLTQAALAERSGVSLGSLRRFETTGKVSLENLTALADVLGRLADFETLFVVDEKRARLEALLDREGK